MNFVTYFAEGVQRQDQSYEKQRPSPSFEGGRIFLVEQMNNREFNQLKEELRKIAFPVRPRPLKFLCKRDGQKVFYRQRAPSYFQMLEKEPKPFIEICPPPKHRGTKYPNRMTCLIIGKLWDWLCDRLFG